MMMAMAAALLMMQAAAADVPAPLPCAEEVKALAQASGVGSALFALDRAAWVSTDALKAALPTDRLPIVTGYVIEVAADRSLIVTYYAGGRDARQAVFVATVRGGKVIDGKTPTEPTPLTEAQQHLANVCEAATAEAVRRNYRPCTSAPFNVIVMPVTTPAGERAVYLLSAQIKADAFPIGGHFRIAVDAMDKAVSGRPYSVSCLTMAIPKLPAGAKPAALFVTHLLDPVPTEIHVFSSFAARIPIIVATSDKRQWRIAGTRISALPAQR